MRERLSQPRVQTALAALLYLATFAYITWPLVTDPSDRIYGFGGDAWADIGLVRELVQGPHIPFLPGTFEDISWPEGSDYGYATYIATWPAISIKFILFSALGQIVGWNVWVLLTYLLSGTGMFLLARRITGSVPAALLAGWVFAFYPFAVENGKSHVEFAAGWVYVLLLWRMLELRERPTTRNGLFAGAAAIVAVSFHPYNLLMAGVTFGVLVVAQLITALRRSAFAEHVRALAVACGTLCAAIAAYAVVNATAPQSGLRSRAFDELFVYSLRPKEFLVPSPDNVLFGDVTRGWWTAVADGGLVEELAYLGISVMLLAAIAVAAALLPAVRYRWRGVALTLAALALVAALFTGPPLWTVAGVELKTPSWFVYQVTPTFRVFSRFVVVCALAVALLAAMGLTLLIQGRSRQAVAAILVAVAVIVPIDLNSRADEVSAIVPAPRVYELLNGEPRGGALAEYPLLETATPEYQFILWQNLHKRPVLNGYGSGTPAEHRARWLYDLADPQTAGRLRFLDVRYVVLDPGPAPAGQPTPGPADRRGFHLLGERDGRVLYRVVAPPATGLAWAGDGFSTVEGPPSHNYSWLTKQTGEIGVMADCSACSGTLRLGLMSYAEPRRVRVLDSSGKVIAQRRVGRSETALRVPLRFKRRTTLRIETTPGPAPGAAGDRRQLSIAVLEPDFVRDGGA